MAYQAQKYLASSDVLSSRHPYAQPAFSGQARAGNKTVDPLEVATAFGQRGIPKLAAVLALGATATATPESLEPSRVASVIEATEAALRTLYEELVRQESRSLAISNGVLDSLRVLIARPEAALKMYSAKCFERLATMRHARTIFGKDDCAVVRGLVALLEEGAKVDGDDGARMRVSAMSALRMLSESRDGCDILVEASGAIEGLVGALGDGSSVSEPMLLGEALFSLGNLTKMDGAIIAAMEAGVVAACLGLLGQGEVVAGVQLEALVLKCLWNCANLPSAKLAIIEQDGVAKVACCLGSSDPDIRRLAVGAMLALLVEQSGKEAAVALENSATGIGGIVEPLAVLLDDESEETRMNAVAAVRSMCDHPAGRAQFKSHRVAVTEQWMDLFPSVQSR